jgi:hypothetical protein
MALAKSTEGLAPSIVRTRPRARNDSRGNVRQLFPIHARLLAVVDALPVWQLVREFLRVALAHADSRGHCWAYLRTLASESRKGPRGDAYSYESFRLARRLARQLGLWTTIERIAPGGFYPARSRGELVMQGGEPVGGAGGCVGRVNLELLGQLQDALRAHGVAIVGPFVCGFERVAYGTRAVRNLWLRTALEKRGWRAPAPAAAPNPSGKGRGNRLPRGGVMDSPSSEVGFSLREKQEETAPCRRGRTKDSPASPATQSRALVATAAALELASVSSSRRESTERREARHVPRSVAQLLAEDAEARAKLAELLGLLRGERLRS